MFGCSGLTKLNEEIYQVQKRHLMQSPFESAKGVFGRIERQKGFRAKQLPPLLQDIIFEVTRSDTIILVEDYSENCINCPSDGLMVLYKDTIYSLETQINKDNRAAYKTKKETFRTVSLDNSYLSDYYPFLLIKKKMERKQNWTENPLSYGSDSCLGGNYTVATVIYPGRQMESMFVRCWWLGSTWEYLKE